VGFRGQTPDTIRRDVDFATQHFSYGCINLLTETPQNVGLIDESIKHWFRDEFAWLTEHPAVEVLWKNTDLGVG
jgi:hypothetical protein